MIPRDTLLTVNRPPSQGLTKLGSLTSDSFSELSVAEGATTEPAEMSTDAPARGSRLKDEETDVLAHIPFGPTPDTPCELKHQSCTAVVR